MDFEEWWIGMLPELKRMFEDTWIRSRGDIDHALAAARREALEDAENTVEREGNAGHGWRVCLEAIRALERTP